MLDPGLDVRGNVELAVATIRAHLRGSTRSMPGWVRPDADEMDALLEEQGKVQDAIEASKGWDLDRRVEIAMDAMRLPPGDAECPLSPAASGGASPVQDPARTTRPFAPRRAHQPPRRRERRLARTASRRVPGHRRDVTHDRYFLDNVAKWILELDRGQGIPWEGNYSSWLEQKRARLALKEKQESTPSEATRPRAGVGAGVGPAGVAKNQARLQRYEQMASQDAEKREEGVILQIPPGPRLGTLVVHSEDVAKGYNDRLLFENEFPPAARRDHRRHRAQRSREDRALSHDRRRGDARPRHPAAR